MSWSQNGKKLAYLAEKKVPKPKPFVGSYVKKDENLNEDKKSSEDDSSTRV